MKRKLNEHDVPEATLSSDPSPQSVSFEDLALDPRLLQAIQQQEWAKPTAIQAQAIPLALNGNDIVARSWTGSGKTAAYLLPVLQKVIVQKTFSSSKKTSALILVPTRELAAQVTKVADALTSLCGGLIRIENLSRKEDEKVVKARLVDAPDVVVATPGRTSAYVNGATLSLSHISHLVIDEADLMLSYDYESDLENISKALPKGVQTFLMSATLRADIETLKGLFCRNPVVLELDEQKSEAEAIKQFVVECAEDEKFLLFYALFKLNLIKGKIIIFVGDIDRSYRLKLFGNQFGIRSCILNSELPVNSRLHIVDEFNRGVYDIIIASDDQDVVGNEIRHKNNEEDNVKSQEPSEDPEDLPRSENDEQDRNTKQSDSVEDNENSRDGVHPKKKRKKIKQDKEYGVARGIDFKNVACVINFDLPTSAKSYEHRIGRTARAGNTGMALSFVIPKDKYRGHKPTSFEQCEHDEEVLAKITKSQQKKGREVLPYNFDMQRLEGFRYRLADALRAVTRLAVRQARTEELRQEIMKSEKLKRYFEENPSDLHHLRHDRESQPHRIQPHLRHVPDYLLPGGSKKSLMEGEGRLVSFRKQNENRIRQARNRNRAHGKGRKSGAGKKSDPLKSFKANNRK